MANITIAFSDGGFPGATFSGSVQDLIDLFAENLVGTIDDTSLMEGQIGGSEPLSDIGPWLDDDTWKVWSVSEYVPMPVVVGDANFIVSLTAAPTANRTQTLQDKDGTIALLSDVHGARTSINLATTSPAHQIDWSASNGFFEAYSADTTYTMINSLPGQEIMLAFTSSGAHKPIFPDTVLWESNTPPANQTGVSLIVLKNVAGTVYGKIVGNGYA